MKNTPKKVRKHLALNISVTIGCTLFIVILCSILSVVSYSTSRRTLYNRYQAQMTSIVNVAQTQIDNDDLYQCCTVEPYTESEKYKQTLDFFNNFVSSY